MDVLYYSITVISSKDIIFFPGAVNVGAAPPDPVEVPPTQDGLSTCAGF